MNYEFNSFFKYMKTKFDRQVSNKILKLFGFDEVEYLYRIYFLKIDKKGMPIVNNLSKLRTTFSYISFIHNYTASMKS